MQDIKPKDISYLRMCLSIANEFSTCGKRQYAAIIVDHRGTVIATGYNGTPSGFEHCKDGGCPRFLENTPSGTSYGNCLSVHAEVNAIIRSTPATRERSTLYVNGLPCWDCAKVIIGSGIPRVVCLGGRDTLDEKLVIDLFGRSEVWFHEVPPSMLEA
jgi:dCMP deaminase